MTVDLLFIACTAVLLGFVLGVAVCWWAVLRPTSLRDTERKHAHRGLEINRAAMKDE
jgi:hypothetical protein